MDYYFATVTGVLHADALRAREEGSVCPASRRYVPKYARPHMAWSTSEPCTALAPHSHRGRIGTAHRLQGNESATSEAAEGEGDKDETRRNTGYGLHQLLTVDAASGLCATLYRPAVREESEGVRRGDRTTTTTTCVRCDVSQAVPSGRRIMHYICAEPTRSEPDALHFLASDDMGNVFALRWAAAPRAEVVCDAEPPHKLRRREPMAAVDEEGEADALRATWSPIIDARATAHVYTADDAEGAALFSGRGAAGWSALAFPHASYRHSSGSDKGGGGSATAAQLVCAREHFFDVRVIDLEHGRGGGGGGGKVVHEYSTTHSPTGMYAPPGLPHCVLVTEGCLATLYDIRCPDHVLSLAEVRASVAEMTAVAAPAPPDGDAEGTEADSGAASRSCGSKSKVKAPQEPLVPGRLTSVAGLIRDVCATANPHEVAMGVDRALHVYDYRKFTRLFTAANVLKYEIASVASVAKGGAVVCAGIDSEVRVVPLYPKAALDAGSVVLSLATTKQQTQAKKTAAQQATSAGGEPAVSTFRTRLNCTVSCETTWHGAWVTAVNERGAIAVGLSASHELFTAQ